LKNKKV